MKHALLQGEYQSTATGHGMIRPLRSVILYLRCRVLAVRLDAWVRFDIHNCGICRVSSKTYLGTQVTGLNDVGHVPTELLTYG